MLLPDGAPDTNTVEDRVWVVELLLRQTTGLSPHVYKGAVGATAYQWYLRTAASSPLASDFSSLNALFKNATAGSRIVILIPLLHCRDDWGWEWLKCGQCWEIWRQMAKGEKEGCECVYVCDGGGQGTHRMIEHWHYLIFLLPPYKAHSTGLKFMRQGPKLSYSLSRLEHLAQWLAHNSC